MDEIHLSILQISGKPTMLKKKKPMSFKFVLKQSDYCASASRQMQTSVKEPQVLDIIRADAPCLWS